MFMLEVRAAVATQYVTLKFGQLTVLVGGRTDLAVRSEGVNLHRVVCPTVTPLSIESRGIWRGLESTYWTNGTGEVINSRAAPSAAWHPLTVRSLP
jgi:hypothetical protein